MGLKILGRVGTHIFFLEKKISLCILKGISGKKSNFMHFERQFAFQNA